MDRSEVDDLNVGVTMKILCGKESATLEIVKNLCVTVRYKVLQIIIAQAEVVNIFSARL